MRNPNEFLQEIHSELFTRLVRIVNDICDGKCYTLNDCLKIMRGNDPDNDQRILELLDAVLYFAPPAPNKKNTPARLRIDMPVPIQPTKLEFPFLKLMLLDKSADFLLPDDTRNKLLNLLQDVELPNITNYQRIRPCGDDITDDKLRRTLFTFWTALARHRMLYYENMTDNGILYKGKTAPVRLEYDAPSGRYSLITWDNQTSRAIKMSARNIQALELLDELPPSDLYQKFFEFLRYRRKEFTLKIQNKTNAVERCFTMFATNDKEADYDEASDTYTLTVYYYEFEYETMLNRVISLGSAATVLKPMKMRTAVIQWAQKSLEMYS